MIFLRRLLDLPLLVILIGIAAATMILPAAYALALGQYGVARAFLYSGAIVLIMAAMVGLATANYRPRNQGQSQLASVIGAYLVLPVILAVPLHQAIPGIVFGDAWFEMMSAFTTTGATIFETPGALAPPIHFWRSLVGWLGGFYILVAALSVLAPIGLGGVELLGGRVPTRAAGGVQTLRIAEPSQRLIEFSAQLFPVYAGLTSILWVSLLLAGDSALIALSHAMGTLSASGISPLAGLQGTASGVVGEVMIFVFLGFAVTHRLWPGAGKADRSLRLWRDPELRLAGVIIVAITVVLVLHHAVLAIGGKDLQTIADGANAVWGAAFTALSFLTTTGFQSASWPDLGAPGIILMGPAIIGGGVATTAGGIKLLRIYALLRHGERELERIVHPHSIGGHGPVARRMRREGAYLAWIFFMIFGLSIAGVTAALTLTGVGFEDALVLAIAGLSTTGQLASVFGDAPISYAELAASSKAVLGAAMVLGRLEILAIFALLVPNSWAR